MYVSLHDVSDRTNPMCQQRLWDRWTQPLRPRQSDLPADPPRRVARSNAAALVLRLALWVAMVLAGSAPAWAAAATVDLVPYFALNPGNVLTYRSKRTIDTTYIEERAEVGASTDFHGVQALQLRWFEAGASTPYSTEYLNTDAEHICHYGERSAAGDTVFDPPICIPRQMTIGTTFSAQTAVTDPSGVETVRTFVWTVEAQEVVSVPAGIYNDALHVQSGWADAIPLGDSWFATGVGLVKGWSDPGSVNDWVSELTAFHAGGSSGDRIGVWRPGTGRFYLDMDGSLTWTTGVDLITASFGVATDRPVAGDWNGDGADEIGVWRPSTGRFYLDMDGSFTWTTGGDLITASFGVATDRPVAGDWNGDGTDEIGVWRPSTGRFYLDMDGSFTWTSGVDVITASFGAATDRPAVGDWDGDGTDEIGVWRPSTGRFYLDMDGSRTWTPGIDVITASFGVATDFPVAGDWNGDGSDEIGVWRPITGRFYLDVDGSLTWTSGVDVITDPFGSATDLPVAGSW